MGRDEVLPVTDASTPPSDETIPADATAETAVEQDVAAGGDALTDEANTTSPDEAPAEEAPADEAAAEAPAEEAPVDEAAPAPAPSPRSIPVPSPARAPSRRGPDLGRTGGVVRTRGR